MSSIGRGRGRGRGAYIGEAKKPGSSENKPAQSSTPAPAPAQAPVQPPSPTKIQQDGGEQLASLVKTLSVGSSADLEAISEVAKRYAVTEGKYEEAARMIYSRTNEDWRMSPTAAKICNKLVQEVGTDFRTALLTVIQKDFKRKSELRQCFPSNFLGCLSFLCQVFTHLKVGESQTEPFKPLVNPVYEAIEMLLDADAADNELECGVIQIFSVGPLLQKHGDSNKYRVLMQTIRNKILDNKGSRNVRKLMIDLLECNASDWTLTPPFKS